MVEETQPGLDPDLSGPRPVTGPWAVALVQPLQGLRVIGAAKIVDHLRLVEGGDVQPVARRDVAQLVLVQLVGVDGHKLGQRAQLAVPIDQAGGTAGHPVHHPRTRPAHTNDEGGDDRALACSVVFAHKIFLS